MGIEVSGWLGQILITAPYALLLLVTLLFLHRRGEVEDDGLAHGTMRHGVLRHGGSSEANATAIRAQPAAAAETRSPPTPAFAAPESPPPAEPAAVHVAPAAPDHAPASAPKNGPTGTFPGPDVQPAPPPHPPLAPPPPLSRPVAANPPAAPVEPASARGIPGIVPVEALSSAKVTTTIAEPVPPPPKPAQRVPSVEEVNAALERAIAADKKADVALLSLYLARRHKASGAGGDVGELLRRAVRLSAELGLKDIQAEARLDLGEEARASGDLTTACEHWQIARTLFEEGSHKAKADNVEARMKRFGCPTDWVLNDF